MKLNNIHSLITTGTSTHTHTDSLGLKGQSAIEYLMTYGWMLLVVAVVGGAIFAVVGDQSVESVTGFTGSDVTVDDFGTTSDGNLQLVLRNTGSDTVDVSEVVVSGESDSTAFVSKSIGVGETTTVTLNNVEEGDSSQSLDLQVVYDIGGLTGLGSSGSLSGNFEVVEESTTYDKLDPVFTVNDSSPEPGDSVSFDGSGSSPESVISSYSWSSDTTLDESSGESISNVFSSEGDYLVNLTVSDGKGNESSYTETVTVSSGPSPADFQLSSVSDDGPVTEGEDLTVNYDVDNSGGSSGSQDIVLDVSGSQEDIDSSVSLGSGGSSTGSLVWSTSQGDSGNGISYSVSTENDSVSGTVDVNLLTGPTASASDNVTDPEVGDVVEFDASASSPGDGSISSYDWDVNNDGNYEKSGQTVTHSYGSSGSRSVELNVTDSNGLSSTDTVTVNVQAPSVSVSGAPSFSTAPTGAENEDTWVPVSPDSGTQQGFDYFFDEASDEEYFNVSEGFYVMKYEAKPYNNVSDSFDSSTGEVGHNRDYVPRSVAANKPWRDISFNEEGAADPYGAVQACQALDSQTSEFDVHLVTNREWMTVARQVEQNSANWVDKSDGTDASVDDSGAGIYRGNTGDSTELDVDGADPASADVTGSEETKRTLELANGEVVWDLSGNVYQWVDVMEDGTSITSGLSSEFYESAPGPTGPRDLSKGHGKEYIGGEGYSSETDDAARRGGLWNNGDTAGVFDADSATPSYSYTYLGFRCSAVPVS